MRRAAAWLLAAVLAGPAVLALALPGVDFDAVRCAMKCGHAVRHGAVCCPVEAGGTWKTCGSDDSLLPGLSTAAPGVLASAFRLAPPSGTSPVAAEAPPRSLPAFDPLLDHVPLALA